MSAYRDWTPEKAAAISAKNRAAHYRVDAVGSDGCKLNLPTLDLTSLTTKPSKYKNVRVSVDGEIVDSKKEAKRLAHLRLLARGGFIQELARQVEFYLRAEDSHICKYVADFSYVDAAGRRHVEDVKSEHTRTLPVYALKRKLMKACLGIEVEEV